MSAGLSLALNLGRMIEPFDPSTLSDLVAWFDPNHVTHDGSNIVTTAQNRALGRAAFPWLPYGANPAPTWGATSFNGTPGITGAGAGNMLSAAIPSGFGNPVLHAFFPMTIIVACTPGSLHAFNNVVFSTYNTNTDFNTSITAFAANTASGIETTIYNDAGAPEFDIIYATATSGPHVLTWILGADGNGYVRKDGVQVLHTTTAQPTTTMAYQQVAVIGGQNSIDGPSQFAGPIGHVMLFNSALSGTELTNVEAFVKTASGL